MKYLVKLTSLRTLIPGLGLAALLASAAHGYTILSWSNSPDSGLTPGTASITSYATGGSLSLGSGANPDAFGSGAAVISASNMNSGTQNLTDYFEFTITPDSGVTLRLSKLTVETRAQSSGTPSWNVRSDLDGYDANLTTTFTGTTTVEIDLDPAVFGHLDSAVTFRIYGWGMGGVGAEMGLKNGTKVEGSVVFGAVSLSSDSLDADYVTESELRDMVAAAAPGSSFVIENDSTWTLTDTLHIPEGVSMTSTNYGVSPGTFNKGFDGALATIKSHVRIHGVTFDGKRSSYSGVGVVAGDIDGSGVPVLSSTPITNVSFDRVDIQYCQSDGYVLASPNTKSTYYFCKFDDNTGHGVKFEAVTGHRLNQWHHIHFDGNDSSSIAYYAAEENSVWHNLEFLRSFGPCFEQFYNSGDVDGGCKSLTISDSTIRENGPAWLNRGGIARGISFENCRMKHNDEDWVAATDLGISNPVGLFHVEDGKLSMELSGGAAWYDNYKHVFYVRSSDAGSKLTLSPGSYDFVYTTTTGSDRMTATNSYLNCTDGRTIDPTLHVSNNLIKFDRGLILDQVMETLYDIDF